MNENILLPLILQVVGVLVIIAEIIIPSGGILSIIALALLGYSLYGVFANVSTSAGLMFLGADIVMIPILVVVGLKILANSSLTLRKSLKSENGVTSQPEGLEKMTGMEGRSVTPLRPSGTAVIDGKRVDVVSRGEFIEKDAPVTVVKVTGNQIIVKQIQIERSES